MTASQTNGAGASTTTPTVQVATALQGAQPFKFMNASDTYVGPLHLSEGSQRMSYLKDLPEKELANELMAATLAAVVGLPSPAAYLVKVDPSVLALTKGPVLGTDRLAFATSDAAMPSIMQWISKHLVAFPEVIKRFLQWPSVGLLYGFDSFVANIDRNPGNLLLGAGNDVLAIDHGRCFTGPQWVGADLKPADIYVDRLKQWLTPELDQTTRAACLSQAATVPSRLGNHTFAALAQANYVHHFLSQADFSALVNFLDNRKAHVSNIAASALA